MAKVVHLERPVEWFGKTVSRIFLREPRASHLQRFGEPRTMIFQSDGTGTRWWAERDDAISDYFEALLSLDGEKPVDGGGGAFLTTLSLSDGIALREALFDFFYQARVALSSRQKTSSEKPTS